MLGGEAPRQCAEVAPQDEGPADGALAGGDEALGGEFETRAPARDEKAVTAACCLITGLWRRGAGARKQAAAQTPATATVGAAADAAGSSSGLRAPEKMLRAVDGPWVAVQRTGDSVGKAAAAKGSALRAKPPRPA
jgi:hypothetical protein